MVKKIKQSPPPMKKYKKEGIMLVCMDDGGEERSVG
jgi:hypothetical protein